MVNIYTALITPFKKDNSVDYTMLEVIVNDLLKQGCKGFVVCGTSGESSTLSEDEMFTILEFVLNICKNKASIIFNCGCNDTLKTLRLCKRSEKYNIDAIMLVTPYYNNPTQQGLYEHYAYIASNTKVPLVLYQVEKRCNITFHIDTLKRLTTNFKNRFMLKYASTDLNTLKQIIDEVNDLMIFCGDDSLLLEYKKLGVNKVISVISHMVYKELDLFYKNNDSYDQLFKYISNILFKDPNPIGIKYLLSKYYECNDYVRLPLTSSENKKEIDLLFDKYFKMN